MLSIIEAVLVVLVVLGSITIIWGVRHFNLSTRTVAITFLVTAASWMALLVVTISLTLRALGVPSV